MKFQTWYEGLTNTKQYPWKNWAFNFIQILSEIAKERPDLLTLVVSVRNGSTEAYQQIHRVNPIVVDFKGENSKRDRKRLLIHRIFENRRHVYDEDILKLIKVHINEYIRLLNIPETETRTFKAGIHRYMAFCTIFNELIRRSCFSSYRCTRDKRINQNISLTYIKHIKIRQ